MARINVIDEQERLIGWFDDAKAEKFEEVARFDGQNYISTATGSEWNHEELYRTVAGRWVLHWWSQYAGAPDRYRFITGDEAREWLMKQEHEAAVIRFWGAPEEERGPGRPEVGPSFHVRLPDELLAEVDRLAQVGEMSRAECIRKLVNEALISRKLLKGEEF